MRPPADPNPGMEEGDRQFNDELLAFSRGLHRVRPEGEHDPDLAGEVTQE